MSRFLLRRTAVAIPTALFVVIACFLLIHLTPGDPAALVAGENADATTIELIRHDLGLDQPLPEQFGLYIVRLAQLDLGRSIRSKELVRDRLGARLPNTLLLAAVALAFATLIGVALGLFSAFKYGTRWDFGALAFATALVSAPTFWVGLLSIQLFAVTLGWLPSAGFAGPLSLILPALSLSLAPLALTARLVRSETLETLNDDYVRTARSKGLPERVVITRHVLRNIMVPVVTVVGLQLGNAFNGAVIIESVFAWPGVGRLLVESIIARDFPVVQGGVLVIAIGFLVTNLLVDLTYAFLDPRIRFS